MSVDCCVLDTPKEGHEKCQDVELIQAEEGKRDNGHCNDDGYVDERHKF
jgi:hypothetical protein